MNSKEIITKIKKLFFEEEKEVVEVELSTEEIKDEEIVEDEDKMEDEYKNEIIANLVDGTEVKILTKGETVAIGDKVEVLDGEQYVKAPEGTHSLEGGLVVGVDAEGFINEMETKEEEVEDKEEEQLSELFSSVNKLTDLVIELKSTITDIKTENTELKEKFNKFAAEPSEKSIIENKNFIDMSSNKEEKLKFFGRR